MISLRSSKIFENSEVALYAVEEIDYSYGQKRTGYRLNASIKPTAVVVLEQGRVYALDMDSNPTSLENLKQDVPELREMLETFRHK